jgi:hypothetical protein
VPGFERATIPWNKKLSADISYDFDVCGARRSRTYVNMVQVVFPEHVMAAQRFSRRKNKISQRIREDSKNRGEIRCQITHLEV